MSNRTFGKKILDPRIKMFPVIQGYVFPGNDFFISWYLFLFKPYCYCCFLLTITIIFSRVFSKMPQPISIKLLDHIQHKVCIKFIDLFFFSPHFRSRDTKDCIFLLVHNFFPKRIKRFIFQIFGDGRKSLPAMHYAYPNVGRNQKTFIFQYFCFEIL